MAYTDILIIGGGAAGLMAAYGASGHGASVTIAEKMPRTGRKIMITGKGRCNFSNIKPWNEFSRHIKSKANFLKPAFYGLPPEKMLEFMERNGLMTTVERGDRAFPSSHMAADVVDTLTRTASRNGCKVVTKCEVRKITVSESASGPIFTVSTDGTRTFSCRRLIIATGGLSYPGTGSTGDGYPWAESFGHNIKTTFPSLTAIVPEGYKNGEPEKNGHLDRSVPLSGLGKSLCGIHLRNVGISLFSEGREIQSEFGELDFTDGGIEGPIGFSISRNCVKSVMNGARTKVIIDLKPSVEPEDLCRRITSLWQEIANDRRSTGLNAKERLRILLGKLMPGELIAGFRKCNTYVARAITKNGAIDPEILCKALKSWEIPIQGYVGYERCVITAGGVSTDEINAKTMESKLQKGLYFCGEIMDIDCDTGGYNMQCAFSTGYLAGKSAAESM